MTTFSRAIAALLLLSVIAFAPTLASAQCQTNVFGFCGDCTAGTPCCGYGPCNIFCGNCDGGCRKGPATSGNPQCLGVNTNNLDINKAIHTDSAAPAKTAPDKSAAPPVGRALFDAIDTDHDGFISLAETQAWATASKSKLSAAEVQAGFEKADVNHDGKIQPIEFDRSLAPPGTQKAGTKH